MGTSSPAVAPPPETVAAQFTKVYYAVAARQPHRLPELYGADSEASHVTGTTLTGDAPISAAALSFPLANQEVATVLTLDAMHTGKGGYVVVVTGVLNGLTFTQTFVLDSAGDGDSKEHFYCRNDIFRFVTPPPAKPSSTPADVLVPKRAQPVQVSGNSSPAPTATDGGAVASKPAPKIPAASAANTVQNEDGGNQNENEDNTEDAVDGPGEIEEDISEDDVKDVSAVQTTGDKKASDSEPAVGQAKQIKARTAPPTSADASTETGTSVSDASSAGASSVVRKSSPTGIKEHSEDTKDSPKTPQVVSNGSVAKSVTNARSEVVPKSSAPKSWASIVSASSPPMGGQSSAINAVPPGTSSPGNSLSGSDKPSESDSRTIQSSAGSAKAGTAGDTASSSGTSGPAIAQGSGYQQSNPGHSGGNFSQYHNHHNGNAHSNGPYQGNHHHGHHGHHGSGSGSGGGWNSVDSKRHGGGHHNDGAYKTMSSNGHHGHHGYHSKHANSRVYGPSAVIQLNSLPGERCTDWRVLQQEFSTEFRRYGHEVRNVEVKVQRGLAFVEYETPDGVRAAVSAWAEGPRDSGPFKGIALSVTEKRPRRPHMLGGDHGRGGGRGSMRGGGRGGRGRGRGTAFGGGNNNSHASAVAPTAASS